MRKRIRIEIDTAAEGGAPVLNYLVIDQGEVHLIQPDGKEIDLSSLANERAAVLRFLLEDATTPLGAIKFFKRYFPAAKVKEWKGL